jgi:endonuclease/exonuclease/phosphatase family metal-dependent hydrolase
MQQKKKGLKLFFLIVYIGIIFLYLLTCLIPFLNPSLFWFIAILGLGFPFLLLLVLICLIIATLYRSKWSFLALAALIISGQQISVLFAFHAKKEFNIDKGEKTLRVLSWNVSGWTENYHTSNTIEGTGLRNLMIDAVRLQNADVLCFQEYFESFAPELYPFNFPAFTKMGFTYFYFSPSAKIMNNALQSGLCIFSKYPIVDSAYFKTIAGGHSEGFSYADVKFENQTIRFFNTHLESPGINRTGYGEIVPTETSRTIISKIKRGYFFRNQQVTMLREEMDKSPHPIVFCGDVDDVPNSYAYFKIKGNMQDAFLEKGSGLGATFKSISPTLRIDYIMADQRLKIEQFSTLDYQYSEHYPQVMDISFAK